MLQSFQMQLTKRGSDLGALPSSQLSNFLTVYEPLRMEKVLAFLKVFMWCKTFNKGMVKITFAVESTFPPPSTFYPNDSDFGEPWMRSVSNLTEVLARALKDIEGERHLQGEAPRGVKGGRCSRP